MVKHLIQTHPLTWFYNETFFYKILNAVTQINVFREVVRTCSYFFICLFDFLAFKRRSATHQSVENDSDGPQVYFVGVAAFGVEYFWGNVVWSSTDSTFAFAVVDDLGGKTEIANSQFEAFVEEEIAQFKVTMDHFVGVQVMDGLHQLQSVELSFNFSQTFTSAHQLT